MIISQTTYSRPQSASNSTPRAQEEPPAGDRCTIGEGTSMAIGGGLGLLGTGLFVVSRLDPTGATELTLQAAFLLTLGGGAAGAALGKFAHRHFCS